MDKVSKLGYKDNSPFRYNPFNIINSNMITMDNVSTPLYGISNKGEIKYMKPNSGNYKFKGKKVMEIPAFQIGGNFIGPKQYLPYLDSNIEDIQPDLFKEVMSLGLNQEDKFEKLDFSALDNNNSEKQKKIKKPIDPILPILGANFALRSISNKVEEGRKLQNYYNTLQDPSFNPTYSYANNDYGQSENRYLGYQKGGFLKSSLNQPINNNYGKYNGIVNEQGKFIDNPTQLEAIRNMINYMQNNQSDQAPEPSNIYRPEFMHHSINLNLDKNLDYAKYGGILKNKKKKYQDGGELENEDSERFDDFSFLFDEEENSKRKIDQVATEQEPSNPQNQNDEEVNLALAMESYQKKEKKANIYQPTNIAKPVNIKDAVNYRDYLISKGLSTEEASGLIGNAYAESNLNPSVTNKIGAFGMFQHLGDRKKKLFNFASNNKKDVYDPYTQLDFVLEELKSTHKSSRGNFNSPTEAAIHIMNKFERPSDKEKAQSVQKRINYANLVRNGQN